VEAGSPFAIALSAADSTVEVTNPAGKKEEFKALSSPFIFTDTGDAGVYAYKSAGREGRFSVNLLDEEESQITSRLASQPGGAGAKAQENSSTVEAGFSLWPTLVVLVLAVLAIEIFVAFRIGVSFYPILVRGCACAALALALANPKIFSATNALDVVLAV